MYDGRQEFSLSNYWKREYDGDVQAGSTVVVLFSIRDGPLPVRLNFSGWMKAVYLSVLAVIVIAEPSDPFCTNTTPVPTDVRGVFYLRRLSEADELPDDDEAAEHGLNGQTIEWF